MFKSAIIEISSLLNISMTDIIKSVKQVKMLFDHASGTPPTRVLTVNNPQLAASNMAIQNASVKELSK